MPAILPDIHSVEIAIIEMTNAFRADNKLAPVKPNAALAAAAKSYAAFLAKSGLFSHTADGRESGERVTSVGYAWCQVAENLALAADSLGFESRALAKKAVEGWINSPGHRENMLGPHVTEIGVGVARAPDKDPKFISVELFARPKSLEYEFQISNASPESVSYSFGGESFEVKPHFAVTHTACNPSELTFDKMGAGARTRTLAMRYEAADGLVYTLMPDKASGLRIEIARMQKVN